MNRNLACAAIRYRFVVECVNDDNHWDEVTNALKTAEQCAIKGGEKGCYGPYPPVPVYIRSRVPVEPRPPIRIWQPRPIPIPVWVLPVLACGGIAALVAMCLSEPYLCPALLPTIERLSNQIEPAL